MDASRGPAAAPVAVLAALLLVPLPALANDALGAFASLVGAALLALQALTALGLGALGTRWALRGDGVVGRIVVALVIALLALMAYAAGRFLNVKRSFGAAIAVVCAVEALAVVALLASLALGG